MIAQVAIGSLDTPIGELWIACSEHGVCKVIFPCEGGRAAIEQWLALHLPNSELITTSALLEQTCAELGEYFTDTRHDFTLPLDLQGSSFYQRVWLALHPNPLRSHRLVWGVGPHPWRSESGPCRGCGMWRQSGADHRALPPRAWERRIAPRFRWWFTPESLVAAA